MQKVSPENIDAILPQTQCGLCGHGGCMPYAEALVFADAEINLCPPGGIPVLNKIGSMLQKDPSPHEQDMRQTAKPGLLAVIRESECIGCTKCIQACPVDAILGSAKSMHTVIANECTGCELCITPCPVDCIDLIETTPAKLSTEDNLDTEQTNYFRQRFLDRERRLQNETSIRQKLKLDESMKERKNYVQAALERARLKTNHL